MCNSLFSDLSYFSLSKSVDYKYHTFRMFDTTFQYRSIRGDLSILEMLIKGMSKTNIKSNLQTFDVSYSDYLKNAFQSLFDKYGFKTVVNNDNEMPISYE